MEISPALALAKVTFRNSLAIDYDGRIPKQRSSDQPSIIKDYNEQENRLILFSASCLSRKEHSDFRMIIKMHLLKEADVDANKWHSLNQLMYLCVRKSVAAIVS